MLLLHVVATPRSSASTTLRVSGPFLDQLRADRPDLEIETLDLFADDLPVVAGENIDAKYDLMRGRPIEGSRAAPWRTVETLINQFRRADICLISAPMWNFGIPYALKYYLDAIVQPGYLFAYDDAGVPVGLCAGKTLVCVTSRGGDYSPGSPMHAYDLQEPYLRAIFGFVGITDITFVNVQPTDLDPARREEAVRAGLDEARVLADRLALGREPLPARRKEAKFGDQLRETGPAESLQARSEQR
ncbi:FMN-dependent NADH-azoreductase [Jidongwangia harbinensis]|uniref:FMN-dependent NADH-azoreductase n=1 Tax=Jidongwangia harbinensis TaxID=2878561 RepID=UPI001CD9A3CE|nr:NAD(P)H-dependent oxidoreductase [Jidongwangia harbinensis]MCA2216592.1 NAD(P)H-dependent oxidoreductase [Jidongwangia harbinensis]